MKWEKEEIEILTTYYPEFGYNRCVELLPDRDKSTIQAKAKRMGIKSNHRNSWSKEEEDNFKYHWKFSNMEILMEEFPDRSYNQLMNKASYLGVKSEAVRQRKGSFDLLRTITTDSIYWWGFIMADGHINEDELVITLPLKDHNHLTKLANKLRTNTQVYLDKVSGYGKADFCTLRLGDRQFCSNTLSKLNISGPKTYNAPDLSQFINNDLFLNFFIGLSDGDGSIWVTDKKLNHCSYRMEMHESWRDLLKVMVGRLNSLGITAYAKSSSKGNPTVEIFKQGDLRKLKRVAQQTDHLERKWNKIIDK